MKFFGTMQFFSTDVKVKNSFKWIVPLLNFSRNRSFSEHRSIDTVQITEKNLNVPNLFKYKFWCLEVFREVPFSEWRSFPSYQDDRPRTFMVIRNWWKFSPKLWRYLRLFPALCNFSSKKIVSSKGTIHFHVFALEKAFCKLKAFFSALRDFWKNSKKAIHIWWF